MELRMGRFPWIKTFDQFDCECQPSLDRKVVRESSGTYVVERGRERRVVQPTGYGQDPSGNCARGQSG